MTSSIYPSVSLNTYTLTRPTKTIELDGHTYSLKLIGSGDYHFVYEILGKDLIYKTPNNLKLLTDKEQQKTYELDLIELQLAAKHNIPYAQCHRQIGRSFVMQKMAENVVITWKNKTFDQCTQMEKSVIDFFADIITMHFVQGLEIASDLYVRNVMRDAEGNVKAIDLINPEYFNQPIKIQQNKLCRRTAEKIVAWRFLNPTILAIVIAGVPADQKRILMDEIELVQAKQLDKQTAEQSCHNPLDNRAEQLRNSGFSAFLPNFGSTSSSYSSPESPPAAASSSNVEKHQPASTPTRKRVRPSAYVHQNLAKSQRT